ncbi:MAG: cyclic nucleotide-binding domain-containing protein [Actinomadura sp.]
MRPSNDTPPSKRRRTHPRVRTALTTAGWLLLSIGAILLLRLPAALTALVVTAALLCAAVPVVGWTIMWVRLMSRGCEVVQSTDELALLVSSSVLFFLRPFRPRPTAIHDIGAYGPGDVTPADRHREPAAAATFWNALTPCEQDALRSVATPRTFPRGATLIREGEHADHIVVILTGWTKICVREDGRERLLAERGPGQLVGERAALQVNVRSATVVALDTVDTLVLPTADFADFISAHPHVLTLVEGQVYDRLTEGQSTGLQTIPEPAATAVPVGERPPRLYGQNCTIISTDIAGFGALDRTADDRLFIQRESVTMMREAFRHADVPWHGCHLRDSGDGMLIVIPPDIPTAKVMVALTWLTTRLKHYNLRAARGVRIQLRTAVHIGPVATGDTGLTGEALILVARLLDAPVLKQSMARTGALLGVIASAYVYESVVRHLDVDGYSQVRCKVKESRLIAWMCLSDQALSAGPPQVRSGG